jgi:hypothetical protein
MAPITLFGMSRRAITPWTPLELTNVDVADERW